MKLHTFFYPKDRTPEASKKKLVFLHGMGGTGALWRPVAAALEDEYDLLCPDQRGHGGSRPAPPGEGFGPLDFARDLVETLPSAGFERAWVIGHSMGVRTACGYAKLNPDGIEGLVLVDLGFSGIAGGGLGLGLSSFLGRLPDSFSARAEARAFMDAHCPDPSIGQYLIAVSQARPDGSVFFPFDRDSLLATIEASRGSEVGEWLMDFARTTGRPVHAIRGATSGVWKAAEYEAERARMASVPNIHFHTVQGAGHGLPFEKRAEFVGLLRGWVG